MKFTLKKKVTLSLLFSLIVLLIISYYSFSINLALIESTSNRGNSNQIKIHIGTLQGLLTDAETGERGYVLTGDSAYLIPFVEVLRKIENEKKYLHHLP